MRNSNNAIKSSNFPNSLNLADITPLHKKDSFLPTLSKIFERILFEEMSGFFDNFLSEQQCGFRKRYSTQHCLLNLLEK